MEIKYPLGVDTPQKRTAFLYRLQEKLRLAHNIMGVKYKMGEITKVQWTGFLIKWNVKSDLVSNGILENRAMLKSDTTWNIMLDDVFEEE